MNKKRLKDIVIIVILGLCALLSFTVIADKMSTPETFKESLAVLNEKQATVMKLTALATGISTALSALPSDTASPIATQISQISMYLLAVACVIFLEKSLLTLMGFVTFKALIPLSCLLYGIYRVNRYIAFRDIAIKLALVGILIVSIVPMSVKMTTFIEETNNIDMVNLSETLEIEEDTTEEKQQNLIDKIISGITGTVTKAKEEVEDLMCEFVDKIAVVLVTSCIIPVGVLLCYVGLAKMIFKFDIHIPEKVKTRHFIEEHDNERNYKK